MNFSSQWNKRYLSFYVMLLKCLHQSQNFTQRWRPSLVLGDASKELEVRKQRISQTHSPTGLQGSFYQVTVRAAELWPQFSEVRPAAVITQRALQQLLVPRILPGLALCEFCFLPLRFEHKCPHRLMFGTLGLTPAGGAALEYCGSFRMGRLARGSGWLRWALRFDSSARFLPPLCFWLHHRVTSRLVLWPLCFPASMLSRLHAFLPPCFPASMLSRLLAFPAVGCIAPAIRMELSLYSKPFLL